MREHHELASQARDYLGALKEHEWFQWAAQQVADEMEEKQRRAKSQAVADKINKESQQEREENERGKKELKTAWKFFKWLIILGIVVPIILGIVAYILEATGLFLFPE